MSAYDLLSCAFEVWPENQTVGDSHDTCMNKCPCLMTSLVAAGPVIVAEVVVVVVAAAEERLVVVTVVASCMWTVDSKALKVLLRWSTPWRACEPETRGSCPVAVFDCSVD